MKKLLFFQIDKMGVAFTVRGAKPFEWKGSMFYLPYFLSESTLS